MTVLSATIQPNKNIQLAVAEYKYKYWRLKNLNIVKF